MPLGGAPRSAVAPRLALWRLSRSVRELKGIRREGRTREPPSYAVEARNTIVTMFVDPRSSITTPDTPALRFLNRGQHLQRLQDHVLTNMVNLVQRERDEFVKLEVTDSASARNVAARAMSAVATGTERVTDVQLMLQLFFCRHVDNFQTFLEETLRAIYIAQPGLLKRAEQTTVAQVLAHSSMEAYIEELIETKIHKLAYKSLRDFVTILRDDIKFDLFPDRKTLDVVELAFDIRNLVTHNYGIVNKIFLSKRPDAKLKLGAPYPVDPENITTAVKTLVAASGDIEKRARGKFKLYGSGA